MMKNYIRYLVVLCMLGYTSLAATKVNFIPQSIEIAITGSQDEYESTIAHALPHALRVASIMLDADFLVDQDDIRYLLGFGVNDYLDAPKLSKAAYYLCKKNKFSQISFRLILQEDDAAQVVVKLVGQKTFEKLKLKGMLLGKDMYRQYYLMEPGDPFEEQKHRESLQRLKERFKEEGYFNVRIDDSISYEETGKNVEVALTFNCGSRFAINEIKEVLQVDHRAHDEIVELQAKVAAYLQKQLRNKLYSKALLNKVTEGLKSFLSRKGFAQAHITLTEYINYEQNTVRLLFIIKMCHKKEIVFFGNHQFHNQQLMDCIGAFGRSVLSLPPSLLATEIAKLYKEAGFWRVSVKATEEEERIFFLIEEGPCAIINEVIFDGVNHFDAKTLASDCFGPLTTAKQFNALCFKQCMQDLLERYASHGYFDARLAKQEFNPVVVDDAHCQLLLTLKEGEVYTVENINVEGFSALEKEIPGTRDLSDGKKIACSHVLLEQQKKWLQEQLEQLGYQDVPLRVELVRDKTAITIRWQADLSRFTSHFGKTVIIGNDRLPASLIMRELPYHEGDRFDLEALKKSLQRLRELDLFDSVMMYPELDYHNEDERPVILKIQPSDPFEMRLRFGIGLQQMTKPVSLSGLTYKLGGTFIIKNPTNAADHFKLELDVTRISRDIVMRYERPWLFGKPLNFFLQGYSTKYKLPGYFTYKTSLYEVWQQGLMTGINHRYERLNSSFSAGIEWMRTSVSPAFSPCCDAVAQSLAFDSFLFDKNIPYAVVEPTFIINSTNDRINPNRGFFTVLSFKGMVPLSPFGKRFCMLKSLLEHSFFVDLSPCTLAACVRMGYILGAPLEHVPLIERFYLGGAHSIRSYYPDGVPPLGMFQNENAGCYWVPQGGKGMASATAELRFPLGGSLSGAVFQDFGVLSNNKASVIPGGKLATATGIGLRYDTPIGPLRFDIAWKWSKCHQDERAYVWYLALGNVF